MVLITEGSGIVPFYNGIGAAVLGTVMDGDCGIDTMCRVYTCTLMSHRRPQTCDALMDIITTRIVRLITLWSASENRGCTR